ncbi:AraC family transcriptional regulator [Pelagicoccus sp. SDUM812003]|uniref:helix-turn-helix transcriptional regulator n=1 Tax=Pelagicoccus sp. SDUM812003 TaxID=3041267 RepID=UPI002810583F|nr:AraC family transcriptional regulator [Pelagicoccus sp. SDUM812003]MDQ8205591.1 AraC family transcriptional regulator [Pelagicoccus sp. SDUM812003]
MSVEEIRKERFRRPYLREAPSRLRPVFDDFHLLSADGPYNYPRHEHINYELILVERGPYRCELNGAELTLENGSLLIVKPGDWHADHFRAGQRHYVLHFRILPAETGGIEPSLFREGVSPTDQMILGNHGHNALLIEELRREAVAAESFAGAVQDALLEALFWRVGRGLQKRVLSPEMLRVPREERERAELAAAFAEWVERPAEVSDVAGSMKISVRQLSNRCRSAFGESPARVLAEFKVRRAEELLRYRGLRVQEVSHQLGFANPFHFSRVFKRLRGYPPRLAVREVGMPATSAGDHRISQMDM